MKNLQNSMLKKGKKGFTLTELAIVIAVIAILIAVLVPTFTSIITNARKSAAAQEAKSAITVYTSETQLALEDGSIIYSSEYYFEVESGTISTDKTTSESAISGMVAYEWQTDDLDGSGITIYVSATYAATYASTVTGFSTYNEYYSDAQSAVTYSSNLSTLQAATTIYVSYIDTSSNIEVWWTVNSFTSVGGTTTANMTVVSGTVSATESSGSYTITVDSTAVTGTFSTASGHNVNNVTVYYYTAQQ